LVRLAGPGATGDNTSYVGVIDAPQNNARITRTGALQLTGWFVDRTATGWAGADDIEVFAGTFGNGGSLLTHAFLATERPDVASAFERHDWLRSGWSAAVSSNALLPGVNALSVYAHTPAKGWWYLPLRVTVDPTATARTTTPGQGFDISFPQRDEPEPASPAFAVVGVNGGRAFTGNPCLARQYVWSLGAASQVQPRSAFYMNTGNPGPQSPSWPSGSTTTPQPCEGSASASCAYDYGWLAAADAYARARSVAGDGAAISPWWLDVEIANSWSDDHISNAADLEGAVDYLRSVNVSTVGICALAADWEDIVGAASVTAPENGPFAGLPNWRPGARSKDDAPSWCSRTVTGGRVLFVQYPSNGFDGNVSCP
jgi:hypothetical protein